MSVEKHYSSLKPHFTLTILPPALYYIFQLFGRFLLHMVKVERCTCPVKHCFLKFRITDRFFVLLKSTESLKSTKKAITRMHWLCGQVSGNILGFFLKAINFFFMSKYFPSSKYCILLVLENYRLRQSSDPTFTFPPPCQWNISLCSYFSLVRCLRMSYQTNSLGGKRLSYACHCSIV